MCVGYICVARAINTVHENIHVRLPWNPVQAGDEREFREARRRPRERTRVASLEKARRQSIFVSCTVHSRTPRCAARQSPRSPPCPPRSAGWIAQSPALPVCACTAGARPCTPRIQHAGRARLEAGVSMQYNYLPARNTNANTNTKYTCDTGQTRNKLLDTTSLASTGGSRRRRRHPRVIDRQHHMAGTTPSRLTCVTSIFCICICICISRFLRYRVLGAQRDIHALVLLRERANRRRRCLGARCYSSGAAWRLL